MISGRVIRTSHSARLQSGLRTGVAVGLALAAQHAHDTMVEMTSGDVSTGELRKQGHPFGRQRRRNQRGGRGGQRGSLPRLPINLQSHALQDSLFVRPLFRGVDSTAFELGFAAPYARFVLAQGGTRLMVARGFWYELFRRERPVFRRTIRDALRQNLHA